MRRFHPYHPSIDEEMEIDRLGWECARALAEDIISGCGWTEEDDDFDIQVEQEARRQWHEELDREQAKRGWMDENFLDEIANETPLL